MNKGNYTTAYYLTLRHTNARIRMVYELNTRLKEENIPLKVLPGMEVGITENLAELVDKGRILTLGGGSHLLVETPFISIPYGIEGLIHRIKEAKIVPKFAHPERCREVQSNPKRLKDIFAARGLNSAHHYKLLRILWRRGQAMYHFACQGRTYSHGCL